MSVIKLNSDLKKNDLIYLINKVSAYQYELGSYIDHFHYNENTIIVKLTNGFIKVGEIVLLKQNDTDYLTEKELRKIGDTFLKTLL